MSIIFSTLIKKWCEMCGKETTHESTPLKNSPSTQYICGQCGTKTIK